MSEKVAEASTRVDVAPGSLQRDDVFMGVRGDSGGVGCVEPLEVNHARMAAKPDAYRGGILDNRCGARLDYLQRLTKEIP